MKRGHELTIITGIILLILLSGCITISLTSGGTLTRLYTYVSILICVVLSLLPIIVGILFLYGGIQYVTSADDPAKRAEAKNIIFNAFLGLVIVVTIAYAAPYLAPDIKLYICL